MPILDLLLPPACASCGRFGVALCAACVARFQPLSRPDDRFVVGDAGAVIGANLTLALAAFAYEGSMRKALQRLKYAGAARVAGSLATAAVPTLRALSAICGPAALVPVPLHRHRERERGYNQAQLLTNRFARDTGSPIAPVLVRRRETGRQHRLDRAARLQNLVAAFELGVAERAPPVAILVDDILTTSATMEACASALRDAGAEAVYGIAIAREV